MVFLLCRNLTGVRYGKRLPGHAVSSVPRIAFSASLLIFEHRSLSAVWRMCQETENGTAFATMNPIAGIPCEISDIWEGVKMSWNKTFRREKYSRDRKPKRIPFQAENKLFIRVKKFFVIRFKFRVINVSINLSCS